MYNTPAASQLLRPPGRQKGPQGFCTHNRIKAELEEEEDSHLDRQITQWRRQASPTTPWEHRGAHLLRQVLEELVC